MPNHNRPGKPGHFLNSKRKTKNIMENSQNNGFLTGPNKMQIAVLDGKTIRKFIKHLKKLGATISINRPNHKNVTDSDGYRIFSALKYSNGWDCRVAEMFVNDLKNIIG